MPWALFYYSIKTFTVFGFHDDVSTVSVRFNSTKITSRERKLSDKNDNIPL